MSTRGSVERDVTQITQTTARACGVHFGRGGGTRNTPSGMGAAGVRRETSYTRARAGAAAGDVRQQHTRCSLTARPTLLLLLQYRELRTAHRLRPPMRQPARAIARSTSNLAAYPALHAQVIYDVRDRRQIETVASSRGYQAPQLGHDAAAGPQITWIRGGAVAAEHL